MLLKAQQSNVRATKNLRKSNPRKTTRGALNAYLKTVQIKLAKKKKLALYRELLPAFRELIKPSLKTRMPSAAVASSYIAISAKRVQTRLVPLIHTRGAKSIRARAGGLFRASQTRFSRTTSYRPTRQLITATPSPAIGALRLHYRPKIRFSCSRRPIYRRFSRRVKIQYVSKTARLRLAITTALYRRKSPKAQLQDLRKILQSPPRRYRKGRWRRYSQDLKNAWRRMLQHRMGRGAGFLKVRLQKTRAASKRRRRGGSLKVLNKCIGQVRRLARLYRSVAYTNRKPGNTRLTSSLRVGAVYTRAVHTQATYRARNKVKRTRLPLKRRRSSKYTRPGLRVRKRMARRRLRKPWVIRRARRSIRLRRRAAVRARAPFRYLRSFDYSRRSSLRRGLRRLPRRLYRRLRRLGLKRRYQLRRFRRRRIYRALHKKGCTKVCSSRTSSWKIYTPIAAKTVGLSNSVGGLEKRLSVRAARELFRAPTTALTRVRGHRLPTGRLTRPFSRRRAQRLPIKYFRTARTANVGVPGVTASSFLRRRLKQARLRFSRYNRRSVSGRAISPDSGWRAWRYNAGSRAHWAGVRDSARKLNIMVNRLNTYRWRANVLSASFTRTTQRIKNWMTAARRTTPQKEKYQRLTAINTKLARAVQQLEKKGVLSKGQKAPVSVEEWVRQAGLPQSLRKAVAQPSDLSHPVQRWFFQNPNRVSETRGGLPLGVSRATYRRVRRAWAVSTRRVRSWVPRPQRLAPDAISAFSELAQENTRKTVNLPYLAAWKNYFNRISAKPGTPRQQLTLLRGSSDLGDKNWSESFINERLALLEQTMGGTPWAVIADRLAQPCLASILRAKFIHESQTWLASRGIEGNLYRDISQVALCSRLLSLSRQQAFARAPQWWEQELRVHYTTLKTVVDAYVQMSGNSSLHPTLIADDVWSTYQRACLANNRKVQALTTEEVALLGFSLTHLPSSYVGGQLTEEMTHTSVLQGITGDAVSLYDHWVESMQQELKESTPVRSHRAQLSDEKAVAINFALASPTFPAAARRAHSFDAMLRRFYETHVYPQYRRTSARRYRRLASRAQGGLFRKGVASVTTPSLRQARRAVRAASASRYLPRAWRHILNYRASAVAKTKCWAREATDLHATPNAISSKRRFASIPLHFAFLRNTRTQISTPPLLKETLRMALRRLQRSEQFRQLRAELRRRRLPAERLISPRTRRRRLRRRARARRGGAYKLKFPRRRDRSRTLAMWGFNKFRKLTVVKGTRTSALGVQSPLGEIKDGRRVRSKPRWRGWTAVRLSRPRFRFFARRNSRRRLRGYIKRKLRAIRRLDQQRDRVQTRYQYRLARAAGQQHGTAPLLFVLPRGTLPKLKHTSTKGSAVKLTPRQERYRLLAEESEAITQLFPQLISYLAQMRPNLSTAPFREWQAFVHSAYWSLRMYLAHDPLETRLRLREQAVSRRGQVRAELATDLMVHEFTGVQLQEMRRRFQAHRIVRGPRLKRGAQLWLKHFFPKRYELLLEDSEVYGGFEPTPSQSQRVHISAAGPAYSPIRGLGARLENKFKRLVAVKRNGRSSNRFENMLITTRRHANQSCSSSITALRSTLNTRSSFFRQYSTSSVLALNNSPEVVTTLVQRLQRARSIGDSTTSTSNRIVARLRLMPTSMARARTSGALTAKLWSLDPRFVRGKSARNQQYLQRHPRLAVGRPLPSGVGALIDRVRQMKAHPTTGIYRARLGSASVLTAPLKLSKRPVGGRMGGRPISKIRRRAYSLLFRTSKLYGRQQVQQRVRLRSQAREVRPLARTARLRCPVVHFVRRPVIIPEALRPLKSTRLYFSHTGALHRALKRLARRGRKFVSKKALIQHRRISREFQKARIAINAKTGQRVKRARAVNARAPRSPRLGRVGRFTRFVPHTRTLRRPLIASRARRVFTRQTRLQTKFRRADTRFYGNKRLQLNDLMWFLTTNRWKKKFRIVKKSLAWLRRLCLTTPALVETSLEGVDRTDTKRNAIDRIVGEPTEQTPNSAPSDGAQNNRWKLLSEEAFKTIRTHVRTLEWHEPDDTFTRPGFRTAFKFNRRDARKARWLEPIMYRRGRFSTPRLAYRRFRFPREQKSLKRLVQYKKVVLPRRGRNFYLRARRWPKICMYNQNILRPLFNFRNRKAAQKKFRRLRRTRTTDWQTSLLKGCADRLDMILMQLNVAPTLFWTRYIMGFGIVSVDGQLLFDPEMRIAPGTYLRVDWEKVVYFQRYFQRALKNASYPQNPVSFLSFPKNFESFPLVGALRYDGISKFRQLRKSDRLSSFLVRMFISESVFGRY